MKKNKFKIGDVAKQLGIKKSISRQWEQEFGLKANDPVNENNRYYSSDDMTVLTTIKNLIRVEGLSIADAKEKLYTTLPATKYIEKPKEATNNPEVIVQELQVIETKQEEKTKNEEFKKYEAANPCTPVEEPLLANPFDASPSKVEEHIIEMKSCDVLDMLPTKPMQEQKANAIQAEEETIPAIELTPSEKKVEPIVEVSPLEEQKLANANPLDTLHIKLASLKEQLIDLKNRL